MLFKLIHQN